MLYDKDIREPLFMYFEEKYGKTRVFEEKRMGNSRADILIITEKDFIGIEIKSDADTYARLSGQVKDYDRYCDYNYVVVGGTHGTHIGEHVPEYWGIITVEETEKGVDFYELRAPSKNPEGRIDNKLAILHLIVPDTGALLKSSKVTIMSEKRSPLRKRWLTYGPNVFWLKSPVSLSSADSGFSSLMYTTSIPSVIAKLTISCFL